MEERDYLHAGLTPLGKCITLADVLNDFDADKKRSLEIGDINERTYNEYLQVCDVVATLGKHRPIESITANDLSKLRNLLANGKGGQLLSPVTHKRLLTFARMVFCHATEELGCNVRYKKPLRSPPKAKVRERKNRIGAKMFEAAEVRALLKAADPTLKAQILLGLNCAFGPNDIIQLPVKALDIKGGLQKFPRPKTQIERECTLWPETVNALRAVIPETGQVFSGRKWTRHVIAHQFKKLAEQCKVYQPGTKTFYSLRRTFETVAKTAAVNQSVIDRIMGHERPDMSEVYNQKTFRSSLKKCTDHVRKWMRGSVTLQ